MNPLMDTLTQIAGQDQKLKQLLSIYQAHQASQETKNTEQEEILSKYKKLLVVLRKYKEDAKTTQEKMAEIEGQFSRMEQLTDELAAAVGACPNCWGQAWNCSFCHGKGKPGTYDLDREAFEQYVLPLFRKQTWALEMAQKAVR
jgi:hypothetical protein